MNTNYLIHAIHLYRKEDNMSLIKTDFLQMHHIPEDDLLDNQIDWETLTELFFDFNKYKNTYQTQADFIAITLRAHKKIHFVKSRVKDSEQLLEKIIRKTPERRAVHGADFKFTVDNYKEEITDLIGIRVIHIFKEDWEDIHTFILNTWKVIEITANVREGDDTTCFEDLNITINSRKSGYRSVHYLIEFFPTSQKVIAEIQVRTIFEEGYGEIDHQLRYSHKQIPSILASNLLLFNRIAGSSDEMASFINQLSKNLTEIKAEYEKTVILKDQQIKELNEKLIASIQD